MLGAGEQKQPGGFSIGPISEAVITRATQPVLAVRPAVQYGDAEDPELAASLPLAHARWVICTAPRMETILALLRCLYGFGYNGRVALTAHHASEAETLRAEGADLVLMPFVDAAKEAAEFSSANK